MNKHKLWQAAHIIEEMNSKAVTMIEFEDGSGHRFNFKLEGDNKVRFADIHKIKYGKD
jgi:hypothetical protein